MTWPSVSKSHPSVSVHVILTPLNHLIFGLALFHIGL